MAGLGAGRQTAAVKASKQQLAGGVEATVFTPDRSPFAVGAAADGPATGVLAEIAKSCGGHVVAGLAEVDGEAVYNSAVLVATEAI